MGRAKKQKHGKANIDGKGRYGRADESMIPRQARGSEKHHANLSDAQRKAYRRH